MFIDLTSLAMREIDRCATNALRATGMELHGKVVKSMKGGGKPHVPSRPGQPPAVEEANYRDTIAWELGKPGLSGYVRIGSTDERAVWLEFGTKKMDARPHFRPVLLENRKLAREIFKREFRGLR